MKFKVGDRIKYDGWDGFVPGVITQVRSQGGSEPYQIILDDNKGQGYVSERMLSLEMVHNRNGANE